MENTTEDQNKPAEQPLAPIILALGKKSRKRIKALKRGKGKLWEKTMDALDQVAATLGDQAQDKTLVPVIVLYKEKARKRKNKRRYFGIY